MADETVALNFPGDLIVAEIEGGSLVLHVWAATKEELAAWQPMAAGIIESIRFIELPPTPRPAMSPVAGGRLLTSKQVETTSWTTWIAAANDSGNPGTIASGVPASGARFAPPARHFSLQPVFGDRPE
jgi:hypothetical protein